MVDYLMYRRPPSTMSATATDSPWERARFAAANRGGLFNLNSSTDPNRDADQAMMRLLAGQLAAGAGQPYYRASTARQALGSSLSGSMSNLMAGLAGRGMLNSGAAAAGQGALYAQALSGLAGIEQGEQSLDAQARQSDIQRLATAAQLYAGIGQAPQSGAGALGDGLGRLLTLLPSLFGLGGLFGKGA